MASTNNLTVAPPDSGAHPRNSVSPCPPAVQRRQLKRRRTLSFIPFFSGREPLLEGYDDCDRPLKKERPRRKSSLLNLLTLDKKKKEAGSEIVDEPSQDQDVAKEERKVAPIPSNTNITLEDAEPMSLEPTEEQDRRRPSVFGRLAGLLRPRRDSKYNDLSEPTISPKMKNKPAPGIEENHNILGELRHFEASLKPLAVDGYLRFERRSSDDVRIDGPSTYYQRESYQNRVCKLQRRSPYCDRSRGGSPDWVPDNPGTPTPETNADADVHDEPHRWRTLTGKSPSPRARRSGSQVTTLQLPGFFKNNNKDGRRSCYNLAPASGKARAVGRLQGDSEALIIDSRTFSYSQHPNVLGREPDLRLRSHDELGVLPSIEASSGHSSTDIPHAVFSDKGSPTSSMIALKSERDDEYSLFSSGSWNDRSRSTDRTSPECPDSPSPDPVNMLSNDMPRFSPLSPSMARFPYPPGAPLRRRNPIPKTKFPSLLAEAESPNRSGATSRTAIDDASDHEGLGLRRMNHIGGVSLVSGTNDIERFSFEFDCMEHSAYIDDAERAEDDGCSEAFESVLDLELAENTEGKEEETCLNYAECCSSRGRSRVRRGD